MDQQIQDFTQIRFRPTEDRVSDWRTLDEVIERAKDNLLSKQEDEGYWLGELHVDATLAADCIFLYRFLEKDPIPHVDEYRDHILERQLEGGGWSIYPGGPAEINATTKSYFALKIGGVDPASDEMKKARSTFEELGGKANLNIYTKFYLACLDQISWSELPSIPPELLLIPNWFPISFYEFSAWSRCIIAPMTIIRSKEPVVPLDEEEGISELLKIETDEGKSGMAERFFAFCFTLLDIYGKVPKNPFRQWAFDHAETWMIRRMTDGGLGAIFPSIINSIIALWCLGYRENHPIFRASMDELRDLHVYEEEKIRVEPCHSSVWDTAWVLLALGEYQDLPDRRNHSDDLQQAVESAVQWLSEQQVDMTGDWKKNAPDVESGAWCFEFDNPWFPDIDDTAVVLLALEQFESLTEDVDEQLERGRRWLLDMRNSDGGWAAFDRDVNREWLNSLPLADHNAILDPSVVDITGRVVEYLYKSSRPVPEDVVEDARRFVLDQQKDDGSWYGRWGVNYVYGTWQALEMLKLTNREEDQQAMEKAVQWLKDKQNEDGGWGESCASYETPETYQKIDSTPSQTAWAVMGLLAGGAFPCQSIDRGVQFLVEQQEHDGTWHEELFTGTGFPKVFYLGYSMYSKHFPLIALCRYQKHVYRFSNHLNGNGYDHNMNFLFDDLTALRNPKQGPEEAPASQAE